MGTDTNATTVVMNELPDCDIHMELFGVKTPAAYDAGLKTPGQPWAFMCEKCYPKFAAVPGRLGMGVGQRLVLAGERSR